MFQIDADYTTQLVPLEQIQERNVCYSKFNDTSNNLMMLTEISIVRIYGVMKDHSSILLNIYNFWPYFYIKMPPNFIPHHIEKLTILLNVCYVIGILL